MWRLPASDLPGYRCSATQRLFQQRWPGRLAQNQFGADTIFLALRMRRTGELMESISCYMPELFVMNIYCGKRRVAVVRKSGLIEASNRDVIWHANACAEQGFDNTYRSKIVDRHYGGRPNRQVRDDLPGRNSAFESQVARQDRSGFKS